MYYDIYINVYIYFILYTTPLGMYIVLCTGSLLECKLWQML